MSKFEAAINCLDYWHGELTEAKDGYDGSFLDAIRVLEAAAKYLDGRREAEELCRHGNCGPLEELGQAVWDSIFASIPDDKVAKEKP